MDPQIIHFTLSGNTIFKKDKQAQIILIDNSTCSEDYKTQEEEDTTNQYNYEHPATLRDICILLYRACGQGVMWQLSDEISKRLHLDEKTVLSTLSGIVREYSEMDEKDAVGRYCRLRNT